MNKKIKLFSILAAGVVLLCCGCSDRDKELKSKVPSSAEGILFIDSAKFRNTKAFNEAINTKEYKESVKKLREVGLQLDDLLNRYMIFGSFTEKYAGVIIQSTNGSAAKLFDKASQNIKKNYKLDKANRMLTITEHGQKVTLKNINADLTIITWGMNDIKKCSNDGKNIILKQIDLKNCISGIALIKTDKLDNIDSTARVLPAAKKLKMISIDVKTPEDMLRLAFSFADDKSANEAMGFTAMAIAMMTNRSPEFADISKNLEYKADKNTLRITVKPEIIEAIKKAKEVI